MARNSTTLLILTVVVFAFCLSNNGVYAFGAGNIPSFAYMEGKAFRHGDIEDVLADLIKRGSGGGFALASMLSKGQKFNVLDVKRVYFGNWLRDYSQAVDIASLKKLQLQTIINLIMVLGFMAHGYATHEFEVTQERLGTYLPTEHIDNPKGYGEGEDPRKYHPQLRPPVDPRELEIDPRTGMKNYIANEQGHWDTSKALVRRTLERCIHLGRQNRVSGDKHEEYEAFRLLGQALHTLEDFSAHSNFCELALVSFGHGEVFTHVGDQVRVHAPNGRWVAPIVTGSFGSSDFIHSLLGEASDHLSEASVSDLNKELDNARNKSLQQTRGPGEPPSNPGDILRELLSSIPGDTGNEMSRDLDNIQRIRAGPAAGGKKPEDMTPQELHSVLWQVLTFRDSIVKKIEKTIQKIPGLGPLINKLMDAISVFVLTTLEPFLKPILRTSTSALANVSGEVISGHDQYEVFNDPLASDPTHSFLSKDHFNLILNEPAGHLAKIVVIHTVKLVTNAWDDKSKNVHQITEDVLQCLFHPDFHNPQSQIQREMLQCMRDWIAKVPKQHSVLQRLSKQAVRNHENVRLAGEGGIPTSEGTFAASQAHQLQHAVGGYIQGVPGASLFANAGNARDAGFPGGPPSSYAYAPGASAPTPMTGEAASYYDDSKPLAPSVAGYPGSTGDGYGQGRYGPPSGPPPSVSFPGGPSPPPTVPTHSGYAPSYAPPYGPPPSSRSPFPGNAPTFPGTSSPPSFPGEAPSFPGSGGYGPPPGPPPGPPSHHGGGYGPPPGPPPGFPSSPGGLGAPPPGPPPFGFPGAAPDFPGGPQPPHGRGYSGGGW